MIALFTDPIPIDVNTLQANEVDLKGSNLYTNEDFQCAITILAKRAEDLRKLITHHVDLEGVQAAVEMLSDPNSATIKVIVQP